jgi:hypothetical protein
MPKQPNSRPVQLKQDEIIERLVPDPTNIPEVKVFVGFLGNGTRAGRWRLYKTALLNDYVEFAEEDLLHHLPVARHGTVVWLKRSAHVQQVRTANADVPDFFKGDIMRAFGSNLNIAGLMGPGGLTRFPQWIFSEATTFVCILTIILVTIDLASAATYCCGDPIE